MNSWHTPYPSTSQDLRHYHQVFQQHQQQQHQHQHPQHLQQQQQPQQPYPYHHNLQHLQFQQAHHQQQLNSLEGVHSGVPTRTTPTLTPTTLRNIEQTFLELSSVQPPEPHTNQAGFVPPLVQPTTGNTYVSVDSRCWGGGTLTQIPHTTSASTSSASGVHLRAPTAHTATSTTTTLTMPSQIQVQPPRRTGGRRPIKDEKVSSSFPQISAEEEERRHLRRERNKLAAARCRKRRLDQTNMLQEETDELEEKKTELQTEIQLLQQQRDELEFLLATHKAVCRRHVPAAPAPTPFVTSAAPVSVAPVSTAATVANTAVRVVKKTVVVKEEPMEDEVVLEEEEEVKIPPSVANNNSRPRRPTSLNVAPVALRTPSVADLGVSIETPSTGLRGFNFDSMMEGGTGLTPVTSGTGLTPVHTGLTPLSTPVVSAPSGSSSNCGTQQRSSSSDLSSPDSVPPKLVSL
ncbi:transcription factor kayak-like isoform X3 [Scylla paramamosain]|uniref:transcription factor kayak-like isoform X3 n=1 Tax=Scylla paramamosain TaxID=85552 RepID=UPI003082B185